MSAVTAFAGFEVGDHVFNGPPRGLKVVWGITSLHEAAPGRVYATIRSGNAERSSVVPIEKLFLHSKGKK